MHRVDIKGYVPGAIGRIAELHAVYYHQVRGFGKFFEAKVAAELSEFVGRLDENRDALWTFQGLNTVRHLYEKCGFKLVEEHEGTQWGKTVIEQKFLLEL